jgi:hypothetical protein
MRRYNGFSNATNTVSTTIPLGGVGGAATTRARVYDFIIGSDATPADAGNKFAFQRTSTSGTGPTLVVAPPLDSADPAVLCFWASAWTTTQPTITAVTSVLQVAMNQRATFRWVAVPDSELVVPASVNNWLVLVSVVASATANYAYTCMWQE